MEEFWIYLRLGFEHICDWEGYDHMLFVITLCAFYALKDWKRITILITAFTIGHSITLALSALNIFRMPQQLVETLIPVTILLTALHNVYFDSTDKLGRRIAGNYGLALGFGFIHGMGFSNYFNALMGGGSILKPLFAFNIGLEIGQLLIVGLFLLLYALLKSVFSVQHRDWKMFFSGAGAAMALVMIIENILG